MERRSPVPYRVGPLAYSPAVMCHCRRKAPCWTSWSNENPGRRYYRCPAGLTVRDCGYYEWIDREATTYERTLLCDLCDAIWQLRKEKEVDLQQIQMAQMQNVELRQVLDQVQ